MEAYEYVAKVSPDGYFSVPEHLIDKLSRAPAVRVMLFLDNDDASWKNFTLSEFLEGYAEKDAVYDEL